MRRAAFASLVALGCSDGVEPRVHRPADAGADVASEAGDAGADSGDGGAAHPIISASALSDFETETHLAVAGDGTVLASFIAVKAGVTKIGYAVRRGGVWEAPSQLEAPDGRRGTDPVVSVDASGRFYLSFAGLRRDAAGLPYDMRIYVARLEPSATAFSPPVDVSGPVPGDSIDKPWGTTDASGRLYVTWNDNAGQSQRLSISEDGGKTFATTTLGSTEGYLLYPCIDGKTGRLHVVHWVNGAIGHYSSDDQGKSWSGLGQVSLPSDDPATFDDPTCAADGGKLWVAYGIGTEPFDPAESPRALRIRIARSDDGGASFASHAFAEDAASGARFLHPQLARGDDGRFHLLYYAGAAASPDLEGSVRLASSNDGTLFSESQVLKAPITFHGARPVPNWLGDYIGLVDQGGVRHVTYTDNSSGKSHVRHAALP